MKIKLTISSLFITLLLTVVPAGFADTENAHSVATQKMIQRAENIALGVGNAPPVNGTSNIPSYIPIIFSAVGNDTLDVGIDARVLALNVTYSEQQIADYLGTDVQIVIKYMISYPDSNTSSDPNADSYLEFLADMCHPTVALNFEKQCADFATEMINESILNNNGGSSAGQHAPSTRNPCDDSANSSTCYFYNRYVLKCIPIHTTSRCNTYATIITTNGYALPTASSIRDTVAPIITIPDDITRTTSNTNTNVAYSVSARDNTDGTVRVTCNPSSGSTFSLGLTRVMCSAHDSSGNRATKSFTVTVTQNTVKPTGSVVFSDNFENELSKWVKENELDWRADRLDENVRVPNSASSNKVAEADNCDSMCTLVMKNSVDLSSANSKSLVFYRFVDSSLDSGEYLKVEAYDENRWRQIAIYSANNNDDDKTWHLETIDLSDYSNIDFKIRFVGHMNSKSEEVAVDDIRINAIQDPNTGGSSSFFITPLANITVQADANMTKRVEYAPVANQESASVTCTPQSGSSFLLGLTDVTCSATNRHGLTITSLFSIFVTPPQVELYGGTVHKLIDILNPNEYVKGTIAIGATSNNKAGIVVAGHTIDAPRNFSNIEHYVGTTENRNVFSVINGRGQSAGMYDAAFIPITSTNFMASPNRVQMLNGTIFDIVQGNLDDLQVGAQVSILGHRTNDVGHISYTNTTLLNSYGVLTQMTIASYDSVTGDSGGPIILGGNQPRLVGIHGGTVCEFYPNNAYTLNFTNIPSLCTLDGDDRITSDSHFKYFSAWEHVKSGLGIQ